MLPPVCPSNSGKDFSHALDTAVTVLTLRRYTQVSLVFHTLSYPASGRSLEASLQVQPQPNLLLTPDIAGIDSVREQIIEVPL